MGGDITATTKVKSTVADVPSLLRQPHRRERTDLQGCLHRLLQVVERAEPAAKHLAYLGLRFGDIVTRSHCTASHPTPAAASRRYFRRLPKRTRVYQSLVNLSHQCARQLSVDLGLGWLSCLD
jgi:hypothetical protein